MTELVLKNRLNQHKLKSILLFLKMMNVDAEIKNTAKAKLQVKPLFVESVGMWAGRDIDLKKIRQERRERRTKYYDNVAM